MWSNFGVLCLIIIRLVRLRLELWIDIAIKISRRVRGQSAGTGTEENLYSRVRGTGDFGKLGTGTGTATGRFLDAKVVK